MTNSFTFSLIALASLTRSILAEGGSYSDSYQHGVNDEVTPYSDAGYGSSYPVSGGSYQSNGDYDQGDYQDSNVISSDQYLDADNNGYSDYSNINDTQNYYTTSIVSDYNNGSWQRNHPWGCAKPATQIDYDYNSYLQDNSNWSYVGSNYNYNPTDCDYRVIYSDDTDVTEGYYRLPGKQFRQYIRLDNGQFKWISFNVRIKVILLKSRPVNYYNLPNRQIYTNDQFGQGLYEHVFKKFSHNNGYYYNHHNSYNHNLGNYNDVDDYIHHGGDYNQYDNNSVRGGHHGHIKFWDTSSKPFQGSSSNLLNLHCYWWLDINLFFAYVFILVHFI